MSQSFGWRWAIGVAICLAVGTAFADLPFVGKKKPPAEKADKPAGSVDWSEPVATVNGEPISREALALELITLHGEKQLELMIQHKMVEQSARERKIEPTRAELEKHLDAQLKKLNISKQEFRTRVLPAQNMSYTQYMRDNVWPELVLTRLLSDRVKMSDDDIAKAFEALFGEKVDVRLLVVMEQKRAQDLWMQADAEKDPVKRLAMFEDFCKTYSIDQQTRPYGGKTEPINKHSGHAEIEKIAFALKPNELSSIIPVPGGGFMILLCVGPVPARTDVTLETVVDKEKKLTLRDMIRQSVFQKKLNDEIKSYMQALKQSVKVVNYLNGNFKPDDVIPAGHTTPESESGVKNANVKPD